MKLRIRERIRQRIRQHPGTPTKYSSKGIASFYRFGDEHREVFERQEAQLALRSREQQNLSIAKPIAKKSTQLCKLVNLSLVKYRPRTEAASISQIEQAEGTGQLGKAEAVLRGQ
jgi:hypothetical protein